MQRFRGKLGGREGTFVLQGSEIVENGKITATWFVVPGSAKGVRALAGSSCAANHGRRKLIDDLFVHEGQPALESAGAWGKQRECAVGRLLFTNTRSPICQRRRT